MLVIEHDMPLLSTICDKMIALELGGVIAEGTPKEVLDHPRVIESYLGTDESAINRSGARRKKKTATASRSPSYRGRSSRPHTETRPIILRRRSAPGDCGHP